MYSQCNANNFKIVSAVDFKLSFSSLGTLQLDVTDEYCIFGWACMWKLVEVCCYSLQVQVRLCRPEKII